MDKKVLQDQLIVHEGLRLKPYRCTAGKLTIGVGRNLDDKGISKAEALFLLDNDIAEVEESLRHALPWFQNLSEGRQRALIDMGFNLGVVGLLKFKRMLAALQAEDWQAAQQHALASKWARDVGPSRSNRIARMLLTG